MHGTLEETGKGGGASMGGESLEESDSDEDFSTDKGLSTALIHVWPVPRLLQDVQTMLLPFEAKHPPIRYVRSKQLGVAHYGFGDASGVGFGFTLSTKDGMHFHHGVWGWDKNDSSSNYQELNNLVKSLEQGFVRIYYIY